MGAGGAAPRAQPPGRAARPAAMIARRPVSGSTRTSGTVQRVAGDVALQRLVVLVRALVDGAVPAAVHEDRRGVELAGVQRPRGLLVGVLVAGVAQRCLCQGMKGCRVVGGAASMM